MLLALLIAALAVMATVIAIVVVVWLLRYRRHRRRARALPRVELTGLPCPPQRYEERPEADSWARTELSETLQVSVASWELADQPAPWREAMAAAGTRLRDHHVSDVTFVHGTFVGTDPLALLRTADTLPGFDLGLQRRLGPLLKGATELLLHDHSNFPQKYPALLQDSTGVPASSFHWSSENGHVGRLRAAVRLARYLAVRMEARPPSARTMLVGHSHAGQVFALLLQLRDEVEHAPLLVAIAREAGEDERLLRRDLDVLRERALDVVTLGTPVRYGWPTPSGERLLHLVNHRGEEPLGGRFDGLLTTRDGDYVQQLGIAGSDAPSANPADRALETELDAPLGPGWAPRVWLANLQHRRRVQSGGFTWLVDYGDAATGRRPNLHLTGLGHAVYTRKQTMAFWLQRAVDRFYA